MNEKEEEAVVEEEAKYVENQRMIDDGNDWLLKRTTIVVMLYYCGSKIFLHHCPLTLLCISSSLLSLANNAKFKQIYHNKPRRLIINK